MPHCAQCLTEYVEGTTECEDCHVNLQPGSPPAAPRSEELAEPKDVKLVTVRVFTGATALLDAEVARNILQAQGMPCVLAGENAAEVLPVLDVPLLVREHEAEKASRILQEYFDSEAAPPPE